MSASLRELLGEALAADERGAHDAAVAAWEAVIRHEAVATAPAEVRAYLFDAWGGSLQRRSEARDDPADLESAIAAYRQAVDATPADSPDRPLYLSSLGAGLSARYRRDGSPADLEAAIAAYGQAVDATPADSPDRPAYLNNFGNRLFDRYERTGAISDLDAAITTSQQAVDATPADSPDRPAYLNNLGTGLGARYARGGAPADLEAAITAYRQAVEATPADSRDRPMYLSNLGNGLRVRYTRGGALADLEAAIAAYREAVDATSADSPDRPAILNNLGAGLRDHYSRGGSLADLEAAITVYREAVDATPADSPARPGRVNNLGIVLRDRYMAIGSHADLEAAVLAFRHAVEATAADSPGWPMYLSNLGIGLSARYARSGSLADLEAAITAYARAVEATPPDSPARSMYLSNLGGGLSARYDRGADLADLEAAITASKQSLETTPAASPEWPMRISNLGNGLSARYARRGALADLEAAITAYRLAADATPSDSPARSMYLGNLGNGLRAYYAHGRMPADLEAAIAVYVEALETTPTASSDRPAMLTNLGAGLQARYALAADPVDRQAAIDRYREACQTGLTIAPAVTLAAAKAWGDWAAERDAWVEAAEAYGHGLAAIDRLYAVQLLPGAKQAWLSDAQGLAAQAAYALARTGDPAAAVLALERGRARLLTEAIERDRADLAEVATLDPASYAAYEQATGELRALERQERAAETGYADPMTAVPADVLQERASRARAALEAAIGRIQRLPGHDAFGLPPSFDEVARAALPGRPLVALLTTATGGLALLVARADGSAAPTVEAIWAPDFTARALDELLVTVRDGEVVGGYLAGQLAEPDWLDAALAHGLPRLGADLIAPVAARLRELRASAVVLLPTGLLGLLPLHAAPYPVDAEVRRLIDEFDVAHTPGTRVLGAARAALAAREARPPVLVGVGDPQPHPSPLAFARAELEEVARFFPAGASHPLYGTAATEPALVELLPDASHVHLACHGSFDPANPLDSALELARADPSEPAGDDGRLRLEEILANDWFGNSRLVVLSACQTAVIDARRLPDEAIGLPGGLLQAGVPTVIGTLWSVDDLSTTLLMSRFYAYHRQGDPSTGEAPLSPAAALRRAQAWLRSRTADDLVALLTRDRSPAAADLRREFALAEPASRPYADPFYWAPFVAIGA